MAVPQLLLDLTQSWARVYGESHLVSTGVRYLHLAGLLVAGGLALGADRATILAARGNADERAAWLGKLAAVHVPVLAGLAMMFASGALMFAADVETFWSLRVYWIKMVLIVALLGNGLLMRHAEGRARRGDGHAWARLRATAVASVVLWLTIVLASTVLGNS